MAALVRMLDELRWLRAVHCEPAILGHGPRTYWAQAIGGRLQPAKFFRGRRHAETKGVQAAFARCAHLASVHARHRLHDGQPQPVAMVLAAVVACGIDAVEPVEQVLQMLLVDGCARVRHGDPRRGSLFAQRDGNLCPRLRMLYGVLQQVRHGAAEQRAFQPRLGQHVALDGDLRARLVEHELEELDGLAHFLRHGREHQPGRHFAAVGTREEQHVVDDGAHALQVFEVGLQHLLELARAALARQRHLRAADEVGQRRAQLVRHVGVERFELAVGLFEPVQCTVEGLGQRREFDRQGPRLKPLRQGLGPQRLRLGRKPLQRPQAHARDPVAGNGHHQRRPQPERGQRGQKVWRVRA